MGAVLVLASLVVFAWAVIGLYRPSAARLPHRGWSVAVWAVSVVLFLAGGALLPPADVADALDPDPPLTGGSATAEREPGWVSPEMLTGPWPLRTSGGVLFCSNDAAWFRSSDGRAWPLNGIAMGAAARLGPPFQASITEIQRVDRAFMAQMPAGAPTVYHSTAELLDFALELCE